MSNKKKKPTGNTGATDTLAGLSMNERKFLAAWVQDGTLAGAARKVRRFPSPTAAASAGHRWKESILKKIDIDFVMESVGLSDVKIFKGLVEGIQATSVKVFQYEGKIIISKPMIDWTARAKHLDMASKIKGLQVDQVKHGLDRELEEKVKKGVVVLPALAFSAPTGRKHTDENLEDDGGSESD